MASKGARDGHLTQPLADSRNTSDPEAVVVEKRRKRRKREANVYDAVAGRVTSTLPLDVNDDLSDSDATATHPPPPRRPSRGAQRRDPTLAPEEVLFRRIGAPVRFAEKDIYRAHEALPNEGRDVLPDSDMVKAVHNYASHFYSALAASAEEERERENTTTRGGPRGIRTGRKQMTRRGRGNIDEQSMDETALLAFGILLEEAGREILGKKGDLVFTEGMEVDDDDDDDDGEELPVDGDRGGPIGFLDARRWEQQQQSQSRRTARKKKKTRGMNKTNMR